MKFSRILRRPKFLVILPLSLLVVTGAGFGSYSLAQKLNPQHRQAVEAARVLRTSEFEAPVAHGPIKPAFASESRPHTAAAVLSERALPVSILMYHHVGPLPDRADSLRRDLTVSVQDFESQVRWLSLQGYTSVTLEEVYKATQSEFNLPPKTVVFTFDDGYADVFQFAVPILLTYHMRGSFAVVPGFLGQADYATWDMVVDAKKQGMEVVSHTENHFDGSNTKFDAAFIKQNLERSLNELEGRLGPIPRVLVYPYGHYTPEYITVAQEVGFKMALTTHFGRYVDPANLMLTPRVRVHGGGTMEKFEESITGVKKFQ